MSWDDGNKGNPWQSGGDKGPADLDAVVRDLQRKLSGLLGGRGRRGGGNGAGGGGSSSGGKGMLGTVVTAAIGVSA